jgi:hypothetical protein
MLVFAFSRVLKTFVSKQLRLRHDKPCYGDINGNIYLLEALVFKTRLLCTLLSLLIVGTIALPSIVRADDVAVPATSDESVVMTAGDQTSDDGVLPLSLQNELLQQSTEYSETYNAAGDSSNIRVHWPTITIILLLLIIIF